MRIVSRKQIKRDRPVARAIISVASPKPQGVESEWSYSGDTGPEYWGDLCEPYALCRDGQSQSPIELRTNLDGESGSIVVDYRSISPIRMSNSGWTVHVHGVPGCAIEIDDERFELIDLHMHCPAEHRIDGQLLPMELHLVHRGSSGALVVLAVLAGSGFDNEMLGPIFANLPGSSGIEITIGGAFYPEDVLPRVRNFFRYQGSRTVPPCDEGIVWLVMQEPIEVSQAQIDAFRAVYDFNARPLQPQNGRAVRRFEQQAMQPNRA